jgi:hypothetical protein
MEVQAYILEKVDRFAQKINDPNWKARLWLALAVHLFRLVEKADTPEHASVLYVEAIKLLDVLEQNLERHQLPSGVPFPGTHEVTEEASGEMTRWSQLEVSLAENLRSFHRELKQLGLHYNQNRTGGVIHYFPLRGERPLLAIYGERDPVQIRLAADSSLIPEEYLKFISPVETSGPWVSLVNLDSLEEVHSISMLVAELMEHW